MAALILFVVALLFFFNPKLLPGVGAWLGRRSRKPLRHAKWMWSSLAGTEAESLQAELEYGRECARVFAAQFSQRGARADQDLVKSVGAGLAVAVKDPRRKFEFAVVASSLANAFALPGGFVFITTSLLDLCRRDRDEIAFFLGHEIGHVLRGHARERMTANTLLNAVTARLPAAGRMLRELVRNGYSRMQELEADEEAVRLAAATGFEVRASMAALKRLSQVAPDPSGLMEYLSSHPAPSERIRALEVFLQRRRAS